MTLPDLLQRVTSSTSFPVEQVRSIVRNAWPHHQQFTPTQAELVTQAVRKRQKAAEVHT